MNVHMRAVLDRLEENIVAALASRDLKRSKDKSCVVLWLACYSNFGSEFHGPMGHLGVDTHVTSPEIQNV